MTKTETDLKVLVLVDDLCEEYERQLRVGESPAVERFVERIEPPHRLKLLRELIVLELGLLSDSGQAVSSEEMVQRYVDCVPEGEDREQFRSTVQKLLDSTRGDDLGATATFDSRPSRSTAEAAMPKIDGYEVVSILGRGGMGIVYKAVQTALGRSVALKMILDPASATPEQFERFEREAKAVAELNDPHFITIHEFGRAGDRPYMALEYVEGGSLEEFRRGEPQPIEFTARMVQQLAAAMETAHAAGLVHRDLKPHNVLLADNGRPKIADFGLVKRHDQDEPELTEQGMAIGTVAYMSPEQSRSAAEAGPAADIHALGAILYCLLTGRPPFLAATAYDTIREIRNTEPVPPSRLRSDVPRDLETICLKCLAKEPSGRYASSGELAADLQRYLDGRPILARPVGLVERGWRWARRNPWIAGLGTTALLAVSAVAVVSTVMSVLLSAQVTRTKLAQKAADTSAQATGDLLGESLEALHFVLFRVDRRLRNDPEQMKLREQIIAGSKGSLDRIRRFGDGSTKLGPRNAAIAHQRMGQVYQATGRLTEALEQYNLAHELIASMAKLDPDHPLHQHNLAAISKSRGEATARLGRTLEARDLYQQAVDYRLAWAGMLKGKSNYYEDERLAAQAYARLGRIKMSLGDPAAALRDFLRARQWYLKVPLEVLTNTEQPPAPRKPIFLPELADLDRWLAEAYLLCGDRKEADKRFRGTLKKRKQLAVAKKGTTRDVALSQIALGDFLVMTQNDLPQAWTAYRPVLAYFDKQHQENPREAQAAVDLAAIHYRVGGLLARAAQSNVALKGLEPGDAEKHFARSCELREALAEIDPNDMQSKIEWAVALARSGRHAEAEKQAAQLLAKGVGNPRLLFQAACTLALCSNADDAAVAKRTKAAALKTLRQLIDAGWKDRVTLELDPDLDPIRGDPTFDGLIQQLPAPAPPPAPANSG